MIQSCLCFWALLDPAFSRISGLFQKCKHSARSIGSVMKKDTRLMKWRKSFVALLVMNSPRNRGARTTSPTKFINLIISRMQDKIGNGSRIGAGPGNINLNVSISRLKRPHSTPPFGTSRRRHGKPSHRAKKVPVPGGAPLAPDGPRATRGPVECAPPSTSKPGKSVSE